MYVDPGWERWVNLRREQLRISHHRLFVIFVFAKHSVIYKDRDFHVAEVVFLLFITGFAVLVHLITNVADFTVLVVAWQDAKLPALIVFIVLYAPYAESTI